MSRSLGIPVKLLHEAAGHVVSVELKSGELYRGSMIECEDNWNCQLENITYTAKVPLFFYVFLLFIILLCNFCLLVDSLRLLVLALVHLVRSASFFLKLPTSIYSSSSF